MVSRKVVAKIVLVILVMVMLACPAYAMEKAAYTSQSGILLGATPRWTNVSSLASNISVKGLVLSPEVRVYAKSNTAKITGTMYLEKYSSGTWSSVTSWSISGTGSVLSFQSYTGISGLKYRTRVVVKVGSESAEATSSSVTL